ncbi:IS607 family transposase [Anaerosalibacter sp. Marseille-P3206]|uniref:IS607 family transposase n=1 Tax=Anaerosalibacter sp. Marseille-P3206 TaxID=1871005 RepID=UPI003510809C
MKTVSDYCSARGYQFKIIKDIGSGLNYNKKGLKELIKLICEREIDRIVINYKDRLIRFGYDIIEQMCDFNGVKIEIINYTEDKTYEEELVEDVLSIITVFSTKLYGSRSHKAKTIQQENKELFK